jgi:hypothetical protein
VGYKSVGLKGPEQIVQPFCLLSIESNDLQSFSSGVIFLGNLTCPDFHSASIDFNKDNFCHGLNQEA